MSPKSSGHPLEVVDQDLAGLVSERSHRLEDAIGRQVRVYRTQLDKGEIVWTHASATSDLTPPAVGNETIVFGSESGKVLALSIQDGKLAWRKDLEDVSFVAPGIVTRNKFISGTRGGQFYCLDVNSGRLYWKHQTDGPLLSPPAVKAGRLFIGSGKNTLYSFNF